MVLWLILIYVWHIPALYEAAIEEPAVHALEHLSFSPRASPCGGR